MGQPLYCSAANAGMWGKRLWWWLHLLRVTEQYHLAFMASRPSSSDISHHNLLPHIPSIHLSTVNSNPCPRIVPQSLNSSSQLSCLPGSMCPCPGYVWLWQGLWFSFHLGCHRSPVLISALNVSPLTQTIAPMWGSDLCFSSPYQLRAGLVLWTLPFFPLVPSFYRVLCGSIYSFPLIRYSYPLSAGVLYALLSVRGFFIDTFYPVKEVCV